MKHQRGRLVWLVLLAAACLSGNAGAQVQDKALMALPRDIVPAETLATLPPGTFLENLLFARDGSLLVTSYYAREVLRYREGEGMRRLAGIDGHPAGLAADDDGAIYVTVHGRSLRDGAEALYPSQQVWRLAPDGKAEFFVALPDAKFLNGLARIAPGVFVIADSLAGTLWRFNVGTKEVAPWLRHTELESTAPLQMRPGANGVRFARGELLVSNSTRRTLLAIPMLPDGGAGVPQVRVTDVPIDDFAVGADGTVFAATHRDQVVRIRPDGSKHVIAEQPDVKGNTAAAFGVGASDRDKIYVVNDGGMFFGEKLAPGLVRLSVGVSGAN